MKTGRRRLGRGSAVPGILVGLLVLAGCAGTREVSYVDAVCEGREALRSWQGLPVRGYVDRDGTKHRWTATARRNDDDSITFHRESEEPTYVRVPRYQIEALLIRESDLRAANAELADGGAAGTGSSGTKSGGACPPPAAGAVIGEAALLLLLLLR